MAAELHIHPHKLLVDETFQTRVSGLAPHQNVTLVARLEMRGYKMISYAHYEANLTGSLDLHKDSSLSGSYTGVEPMGLIWGLKMEDGQRKGTRLMKKDVETPMVTNIYLYDGHFKADDQTQLDDRQPLASGGVNRWYLGSHVKRTVVKEGRLYATFFIPEGEGPFPGVVDMFGTIGGLVEYRAALMASRGFATLALNYFNPGDYLRKDMEYYIDAVEWLERQPGVIKGGVGVIGVSKGFDLALLMAVVCPKVKAVVGLNGLIFPTLVDHTFENKTFPCVDPADLNISKLTATEDGIVWREVYSSLTDDEMEKYSMPIESSDANFLLCFSEDDQCCDYEKSIKLFRQRFTSQTKYHNLRIITYPGAGHLLEPPHSPHCYLSHHGAFNALVVWGGEPKAHARAQEDLWQQVLTFFREKLSGRSSDMSQSKL